MNRESSVTMLLCCLLGLLSALPAPAAAQASLPKYTWVDKTQSGLVRTPFNEVILIGLTWDGSMARDVVQRAYDDVLSKAKAGKLSLGNGSRQSGLKGKNIYLFGYYDTKHKKGDWFAVFPGIRTSNGAPACERLGPDGKRTRTTSEARFVWNLTNHEAVIVNYNSTSSGFKYGMTVTNPDVTIRGK